jgi:hypothetical protein
MRDYEPILVEYWKGERGQRKGYRKLADWFNVTLLRREMDKAGVPTLGNEAESKYERLQGDDTVADEVRTTLRTDGVPVDELEDDFVSYGVIRTHLRDCLGAEYEFEAGDWERDAIEQARSYAESKISDAVQTAVSKGKIEAVGEISVTVSVDLKCGKTHANVPAERAFRRGYVSKPVSEELEAEAQSNSGTETITEIGPNGSNGSESQ